MSKSHYITDKENSIDIAISNFGEADRVFDLIKFNNIGFEGSLNKGTDLLLPKIDIAERNDKLLAHFKENNIKIATDTIPATEPIPCWILATGSWRDEGCWDDNNYWKDN